MRKGVNPEKNKNEKNTFFFHRIIIPVFIPNTSEEFYKESVRVFDRCLSSLLRTINNQKTAITLINNNSCIEAESIIMKYAFGIDKIVHYRENKGKILAVMNEAKAAYEPFITISDADVLFISGWEEEICKVFEAFPKAGVVSPLPTPNNTFISNSSLFFDKYFIGKIKYKKIVSDIDLELYKTGINFPSILDRTNRKFSWKEKQYYINGKYKAVAGACHFVATYRSFLFKDIEEFPYFKFKNGYEKEFLDDIADRQGYYRLSVNKTYAYHMGNKLDENILISKEDQLLTASKWEKISEPSKVFFPVSILVKRKLINILRIVFKL